MAEGDGEPLEPWLEQFVEAIRFWHSEVLTTGGAAGEHTTLLISSVGRAFQSAFGDPAYPTDVDKAAALFHGIIRNHVFVDGNKRTATLTLFLFLISTGHLTEHPSSVEIRMIGELAIETALGHLTVDDLVSWFHRILGV